MIKFDAAKALEHRIVLLAGEEASLRKKALSEMIDLASAGDDFDLEMFVADASSPVQWLASAGTAPFLSPRRIAVVRNLLRCDEPEKLEGARLPETALLILVADEEPKNDERGRSEGSTRKWEKVVKDAKGLVHTFKIDPKELIEIIRSDAKAQGKTMSPAAAEKLAEMCGGSLSRATEELEKLILFAGSNAAISERDLDDVVVPSRDWNIFKMIDAVIKGDAGAALAQMRVMMGSNKAEGAAFSTIFPMISRQLKLIAQARAVLDAGGTPDNMPAVVVSHFPAKQNLHAEKDYPRKLAFQFARSVSMRQLHRSTQILADTDARMKGLLPSFSTSDTLERMVLDLIDCLRKRAA